MTVIKFQVTPVFEKHIAAINAKDANGNRRYRYIIHTGSSRSSKTWTINQSTYINCADRSVQRMTVWRKIGKNCRDTVAEDFRNMLISADLYDTLVRNKTKETYTSHDETCKIEFNGTDDSQKVHGLTQTVAWFNEANEIPKKVFDQIDQRTADYIIIDWNPQVDCWIDQLTLHPRAIVIHSMYKDNPFCPVESRIKIEGYEPTDENVAQGTADKFNWEVYGLGIKAKQRGIIYPLWQEYKGAWPKKGKKKGYGLDFGFTAQGACVRCCIYDSTLYVDEIYYETGLFNVRNDKYPNQPSIQQRFEENKVKKLHEICADEAEPRSIKELKLVGYTVRGVSKGGDSKRAGIKILKSMPVFVTSRSLNVLYEMRNYKWVEDPATGLFTDEPQDFDNHLMDAIRYYALRVLKTSKQ